MYNPQSSSYFYLYDLIIDYYRQNEELNWTQLARLIIREENLDASEEVFRKVVKKFVEHEFTDKELLKESAKLAQQKQRLQDTNRIERKAWRESTRLSNALEEYNQELIKVFKDYRLHTKIKTHKVTPKDNFGVLHLTDAHFNELVNQGNNVYDFNVASKRCKKFVNNAIIYFDALGVKDVLFAITGDLMNSDRRLDELLNMATNRSRATFLASEIVLQMILQLNEKYNVRVATVTGNESRMGQNVEWTDIMATDNYDYTIHHLLKNMLEFADANGSDFGVKFLEGDWREKIVDVGGKIFLLAHGNQSELNKGDLQKGVQTVVGKYVKRGIRIDYVIFGHIHTSAISDTYARGASLVGDNAYSDNALQLAGGASQNIYIVNGNDIHGIRIDLQDVSDVDGYDIHEKIAAYNPKSADKLVPHKTIFEVQI